jgi:hypothetical protein
LLEFRNVCAYDLQFDGGRRCRRAVPESMLNERIAPVPVPAVRALCVMGGSEMRLALWLRGMASAVLSAVALSAAGAGSTFIVPAGDTFSLAGATLVTNCGNELFGGLINLDTGRLAVAQQINISGTVNGGSSTINLSGDWIKTGTFNPGTSTVQVTTECRGTTTFTGTNTFYNLQTVNACGGTIVLPGGQTQTVLNHLNLQGCAGNPLTLTVSGTGPAYLVGPPDSTVLVNAVYGCDVFVNGQPGGNCSTPALVPTLSASGLALMTLLLMLVALVVGRQGWPRRPVNNRRG